MLPHSPPVAEWTACSRHKTATHKSFLQLINLFKNLLYYKFKCILCMQGVEWLHEVHGDSSFCLSGL